MIPDLRPDPGRPPRVQLTLDDGRKSSRTVAGLLAAVWPEVVDV